jgi:hypothetical protein
LQVKIARQKMKSSRVEGEDQGALNSIIDCRNDEAPVSLRPLVLVFQFDLLLQEFTSSDAAGPSALAPPCVLDATSEAKLYPVKKVSVPSSCE